MMKTSFAALTATVIALNLAGCASSSLFKLGKDDFSKTGPRNPMYKIVALWQAGEGAGIENRTSRGFAGQILFFGKSNELPAQVEGGVRIYVFDDQGTPEEQIKPIHEFNFTPGAWKAHLFNGKLGPTYDVFIPYTRPGYHEAKCTIRMCYTPPDGPPVYSEMVNVVLPGAKKNASGPAASSVNEVPEEATNSGDESGESGRHEAFQRTPSRAHSLAEGLPSPEQLEKLLNRRPVAAAELNAVERRRILREAQARIKADSHSEIVLAGYEESDDDSTTPRSTSRRSRHNDEETRELEQRDSEAAAAPSGQAREPRHLLDD